MDIREYEDRLNGALITAKELLSQSGYSDNRTLEYIDYDEDDPNEAQRWDELMKASEALLRLTQNLDYIRRPVPEQVNCTLTAAAGMRMTSTSTPAAPASSSCW